jgi:integrase
MAVYGHRGTLDFTAITQPWLRQAAMAWASEDAPKRRGRGATSTIQTHVYAFGMLSASLRLQRDDHGMDPAALGRADIVDFLNRLAHLEALEGDGRISNYMRRKMIRHAGKMLRDCRAFGLTRPGQPLTGLPDDFAIRHGDAPKDPDRPEQGSALPPVVLEQLVAALPRLEERSGREVAVTAQLLIDTGRRPDEICKLPWDCLEQGPDGKHALIYTNFKNNRVGRRLAIADATARLIIEQQRAVRARFPDTPLGELVLLPRVYRNPHGTRCTTEPHLQALHRRWVTSLPPLWSGERAADGTQIPFDKARVVPSAYRHSFAQRHADKGTPMDVLCELMDHESPATTQIYYRVTAKRTRAAVDKLAALQFDGRGNRVWLEARALLEHEHQRHAVGQVAVPFGICTEPSNVKAGGHACPFRFRCVGCGHFRSDPSYLPELRGYLDMLLRNRERVRAAVELEEWARAEATPSDQEISRVRALIRRVETDLEQLSDDERRQIDETCRVVRATRQVVHLGMPATRPPDLDPTLAFNREADVEPNRESLG